MEILFSMLMQIYFLMRENNDMIPIRVQDSAFQVFSFAWLFLSTSILVELKRRHVLQHDSPTCMFIFLYNVEEVCMSAPLSFSLLLQLCMCASKHNVQGLQLVCVINQALYQCISINKRMCKQEDFCLVGRTTSHNAFMCYVLVPCFI